MKVQGEDGYAQQDAKGEWTFFDSLDNPITTIGKDVIPEINEGVVDLVLGIRVSALNSGAQIHANNLNATISGLLGVQQVVQQLNGINQSLAALVRKFAPPPKSAPGKKAPAKRKRGKK
jgi:hypothetical protein